MHGQNQVPVAEHQNKVLKLTHYAGKVVELRPLLAGKKVRVHLDEKNLLYP